jgi:peptidoglycan/xylan/chitin deacetylase (PgdA/CDA1 family)
MKRFLISVDVEEDISLYLSKSYKGVEEGLPRFLDLLESLALKADFFFTSDVCLRYPKIVRRIAEEGHGIGCHGYTHKELWFKTYGRQLRELREATESIERISGIRPKMFRAPRFSANGRTIKALEELGYRVDSSVMPGRVTRIFRGLFKVQSFEGAPKAPYHPSYRDIAREGDASILEVPLTESPVNGITIGAGSLNKFGLEKMEEAIELVEQGYIIFLIHPWELIDLGEYYPKLKDRVKEICSNDLEPLRKFFESIHGEYEICCMSDVVL